MREHEAAKRPAEEADGIDRQHGNQGGIRVGRREEQLAEHHRAKQAVEREVVVLDGGPEKR